MIKELTKLTRRDLLKKLIKSQHAFACWRLPSSQSLAMAISLETPQHLESNLMAVEPGFLVNHFEDNHPIKPLLIKADILVRDEEIEVSPTISSVQLDKFLEKLNTAYTKDRPLFSGKPTTSSAQTFEELVEIAVKRIERGDFEKVVLARSEDARIPSDFDLLGTLELMTETYPSAFCSLFTLGDGNYWMGASPELLLSSDEHKFETVSLAGTKTIETNQSLNEIAWTQKEIEEQAFVSRYIINCFKRIRLREFHEHGPKTTRSGNLAHLKTTYSVDYRELQFEDLADQMIELLHPTSAVCGMPLPQANDFIQDHEGFDREYYAGFLGPVNVDSSTHLFVNLRCVKFRGQQVRYYAGAGITEDSNPKHEFEETKLKMAVMRDLIER